MPALLVDRLQCLDDTAEWTPDEVYLLVACGRMGARGRLAVLTLAAPDWRGLVRGEQRRGDLVIDAQYAPDKIYVAALVEQDGARDLADAALQARMEQELSEILQMFASVRGATQPEVAEQLRHAFDLCLAGLRRNDEPIGVAQIVAVPAGSGSRSVTFKGARGSYRIDLKIL